MAGRYIATAKWDDLILQGALAVEIKLKISPELAPPFDRPPQPVPLSFRAINKSENVPSLDTFRGVSSSCRRETTRRNDSETR